MAEVGAGVVERVWGILGRLPTFLREVSGGLAADYWRSARIQNRMSREPWTIFQILGAPGPASGVRFGWAAAMRSDQSEDLSGKGVRRQKTGPLR